MIIWLYTISIRLQELCDAKLCFLHSIIWQAIQTNNYKRIINHYKTMKRIQIEKNMELPNDSTSVLQ